MNCPFFIHQLNSSLPHCISLCDICIVNLNFCQNNSNEIIRSTEIAYVESIGVSGTITWTCRNRLLNRKQGGKEMEKLTTMFIITHTLAARRKISFVSENIQQHKTETERMRSKVEKN